MDRIVYETLAKYVRALCILPLILYVESLLNMLVGFNPNIRFDCVFIYVMLRNANDEYSDSIGVECLIGCIMDGINHTYFGIYAIGLISVKIVLYYRSKYGFDKQYMYGLFTLAAIILFYSIRALLYALYYHENILHWAISSVLLTTCIVFLQIGRRSFFTNIAFRKYSSIRVMR